MSASFALIGGEEFSDGFEAVHAVMLGSLGKPRPRVAFLPSCAAHDGADVVEHWCRIARERLGALGAEVETPRVVDAGSASDPHNARLVAGADCVYVGGGFPHVGLGILRGSRVLEALLAACARGALIAGASAGAMLMGALSFVITPELSAEYDQVLAGNAPADWDPPMPAPLDCLGLVPRTMIAPHFNLPFPLNWVDRGFLPEGFRLIGIDEQTALVTHDGAWTVLGGGRVVIAEPARAAVTFRAGDTVAL